MTKKNWSGPYESISLPVVLAVLKRCRPGYWISARGVTNRCELGESHIRNLLAEAVARGYAETTIETRTSGSFKRQMWRIKQ